jgi:chemotaxis protein methyltransferase WspC
MMSMEATRAWIVRELGLSADLLSREPLRSALAQRARAVLPDACENRLDERYAELLAGDAAEAERVRATIAVPETWLFRGRETFEFLRLWLRGRRGGVAARSTVRMLSAGCASGAEPISMVSTAVASGIALERCVVEAIDANEAALASIDSLLPSGLMLREGLPSWAFGVRADERAPTLDHTLRRAIRPRCADLLRWTPEGAYDAIFCRHLLIYLAPEARRTLVERLIAALAPDGLLVVGAVEATLVPRTLRPVGPTAACAFERGERLAPATRRPNRAERVARPALTDERATKETRQPSRVARLDEGEREERVARARVQGEPTSVDAHRSLAECLLRGGRDGEAEASLRKALYLDPDDERTLVLLAQIAGRSGRSELAERYRLRALESHLKRAM